MSGTTRPAAGPDALFLLGPARSGTSLLYKVLCLHPSVGYISNWVARFPAAPALAALNRVPPRFPSLRRSIWFGSDSNAYVYGSHRARLERLFPMPVEGEPLFRRCGITEFSWESSGRPDRQQRALRNALASLGRAAGAQLVVTKRIANNRRIPQLAVAMPNARFLSIVRDGRAVARSLSRVDWWEDSIVWWYGDTPRRWREEGGDPWEICARNWVEELREIETGLASVPDSQQLQIKYETFVDEPLITLEKVAAFARLTLDRGWLDELARLSFPNRNNVSAGQLDAEVTSRVEAIQRNALEAYGYAC